MIERVQQHIKNLMEHVDSLDNMSQIKAVAKLIKNVPGVVTESLDINISCRTGILSTSTDCHDTSKHQYETSQQFTSYLS